MFWKFCYLGGGVIVRGVFVLGGNCPGGNCPGVIVRGVIVRGVIVLEPHNTYVIHRLSLKKNGSPVRNIGFTKYFLTNICCAVILICNFQITYMA